MSELHCWEGWEDEQLRGYTCMLEAGHEGPHEWTPNGAVVVRFVDADQGDEEA